MDLAEFESKLVDVIGRPSELRPFVCEGSPLACRAFLVGANPATALGRDFWSFWEPGYGFRKDEFIEYYARERVARGKRAVSPTRRVLERIAASTNIRCLETNTFATPTQSLAELAHADRVSDPLDFLLVAIQPRIVVAYGADARRHLERRFALTLAVGEFVETETPWGSLAVRAEPHFSLGYSYDAAGELGDALRQVAR